MFVFAEEFEYFEDAVIVVEEVAAVWRLCLSPGRLDLREHLPYLGEKLRGERGCLTSTEENGDIGGVLILHINTNVSQQPVFFSDVHI